MLPKILLARPFILITSIVYGEAMDPVMAITLSRTKSEDTDMIRMKMIFHMLVTMTKTILLSTTL